jgi:SAM-dependent methyltransferase
MTLDEFTEYLAGFGVFASPAEAREYVGYHWQRLHRTLESVPDGTGRLLEIGAAPFAMTLMLLARRRYEVHVVNYGSPGTIRLVSEAHGERHDIPSTGINVECDPFPYAEGFFDVVVCAEVIEHLTFFPSWMLYEIHRVLAPGGRLVLTTPNAMRVFYRYANAVNAFRGLHVADPFSGYGPYGRHNREYTPAELRTLLESCGFAIDALDVIDLEPREDSEQDRDYARLIEVCFAVPVADQDRWRGGQMIVQAHPGSERILALPDALYKSTHAIRNAQRVFPKIP